MSGRHQMSWCWVQSCFPQTMLRYPAVFPLRKKYIWPSSGLSLNKQISEGWNEPGVMPGNKGWAHTNLAHTTLSFLHTCHCIQQHFPSLSMGLGNLLSHAEGDRSLFSWSFPKGNSVWGRRWGYKGQRRGAAGLPNLRILHLPFLSPYLPLCNLLCLWH